MCTVSFVGDHFRDKWYPEYQSPSITIPQVSRAEFEDLKQEVLHMKELLRKAKDIDRATGQPDCEMEDKIRFIREIAEAVGVDLADVLEA